MLQRCLEVVMATQHHTTIPKSAPEESLQELRRLLCFRFGKRHTLDIWKMESNLELLKKSRVQENEDKPRQSSCPGDGGFLQ